MAYPFYPTGYPQYGNYFPQGYQPQQQIPQMVQSQTPSAQNPSPSGIIWISGISEAQMYPVAPNNAVALWENSGKVIYLKQADATGKPTMRIYDLVERTEPLSAPSSTADGKTPDYATKDDLGKIVGVVKGIDDIINSMRTDIDAMKSDMYGIAGKKKPTAKKEVVEDDA